MLKQQLGSGSCWRGVTIEGGRKKNPEPQEDITSRNLGNSDTPIGDSG
jgi:hypothetical protein